MNDDDVPTETEAALLESTKRGLGVAVGTVVAGPIGAALGFLMGEFLQRVLPDLRVERSRRLFEELRRRLTDAEADLLRLRAAREEYASYVQEAMFQASRKGGAPERIEYLAALLKSGMTAEEGRLREHEHLMSLLADLSDEEVILLRSVAVHPDRDGEFRTLHKAFLNVGQAHIGAPEEDHNRAAVRRNQWDRLMQLGLVSGESGRKKTATWLGRLLLVRIAALSPDQR
jgi:hypothetical protein